MNERSQSQKARKYADRIERYAEARRRNRRKACREAGTELRERLADVRRQLLAGEELQKSA